MSLLILRCIKEMYSYQKKSIMASLVFTFVSSFIY
jgi:hypothetical protein